MELLKVIVFRPGFNHGGFVVAKDAKITVPTEAVPVTMDFAGAEIGKAALFTDEDNVVYADITIHPDQQCFFDKIIQSGMKFPSTKVSYDKAEGMPLHSVAVVEVGIGEDNVDHTIMPITKGLIKDIAENWKHADARYYHAGCNKCGWHGSSEHLLGGGQIADTGDYDDAVCPRCGSADIDEAEDQRREEKTSGTPAPNIPFDNRIDAGGPPEDF